MNLKDTSTKDSVDELAKRQAVISIRIDPYEEFQVFKEEELYLINTGPARILAVMD